MIRFLIASDIMKTLPLALLPCLVLLALGALPFNARAQPVPMPYPAAENSDPDSHLPKLLAHVDPLYPAALLGQRAEGEVHVAFVVDATGTPVRVRAFFGREAALEKSAEDAVKQWKFSPGVHLGRVVSTQMVVAIHFAPPPPAATP